jgi:hypothetical protein
MQTPIRNFSRGREYNAISIGRAATVIFWSGVQHVSSSGLQAYSRSGSGFIDHVLHAQTAHLCTSVALLEGRKNSGNRQRNTKARCSLLRFLACLGHYAASTWSIAPILRVLSCFRNLSPEEDLLWKINCDQQTQCCWASRDRRRPR